MSILLLTFILLSVVLIHSKSVFDNVNQVLPSNVQSEFNRKKRQVSQQSFTQSPSGPNNGEINFLEMLDTFSKLLQEANPIIQSNPSSSNSVNSNVGVQFLPNGNQQQQNLPNGYGSSDGLKNAVNVNQNLPSEYQNQISGNQYSKSGYQYPQNGYQYSQNAYPHSNQNQIPQNGYQSYPNSLQSPSNSNFGMTDSQCAAHIRTMESMYVKILEEIAKEVKAAANRENENGVLKNLVGRFDNCLKRIRNFAGVITLGLSDRILNRITKRTN